MTVKFVEFGKFFGIGRIFRCLELLEMLFELGSLSFAFSLEIALGALG